jgi:polyhydroxybutyrate depolymerase
VSFLLATLDEVANTYTIDPRQVYVAGLGNGGSMALRLACSAPERFAGVATAGTLLWEFQTSLCDTAPPAFDLLMMLGETDAFFPVTRRTSENGNTPAFSLADTQAFWAEKKQCTDPVTEGWAMIYNDCAQSSRLAFYTLPRVGHNWLTVGDFKLNQFGIDMTAIAWQFFQGQDIDWSTPVAEDAFNGIGRSYSLYVPPSYDPSEPTALVLALHGRPHNGYGFAYLLDMNAVAQRENFIVAYPDGLESSWNYVAGIPGYANYHDTGGLDVAFLVNLAEDLSQVLNIDPNRRYLTGFSNGGFMTQRVACEAGDYFAAFGILGATFFPGFAGLCLGNEISPVPLIFLHGTKDPSIPWAGIRQGQTIISTSVPDTLSFWAAHDGCSPENAIVSELPATSADTRIDLFEFKGCENETEIILYAIINGGHTIPGVPRMDETIFGLTNMDIHAPQVIWEFFARHPRQTAN